MLTDRELINAYVDSSDHMCLRIIAPPESVLSMKSAEEHEEQYNYLNHKIICVDLKLAKRRY